MRLITFPFAGGNRYSLGFIGDLLPPAVEWVSLEYPGRGVRMFEPLLCTARELADDMAGLLPGEGGGSYVLMGDCIGALLAFLVTRKLAAGNQQLPVHLIVSGCPAPSLFLEKRTVLMQEAEMKERLIQFGTDPALVQHRAFFDMIEPIMRSDFVAFNEYLYTEAPPLPVPVTVLASEQPVDSNELHLWQRETIFPLERLELPGTLKNATTELTAFFQQLFGVAVA